MMNSLHSLVGLACICSMAADPASTVPKDANPVLVDPLKAFERDLVSDGLVSADELRAIEKEIDAEVQDCVDFALNAPEPDGSELTRYIWAED